MSLEKLKAEFEIIKRTILMEVPDAKVEVLKLEELNISTTTVMEWRFVPQVVESVQQQGEPLSTVLDASSAKAKLIRQQRYYESHVQELATDFKAQIKDLAAGDKAGLYHLFHEKPVLHEGEPVVYADADGADAGAAAAEANADSNGSGSISSSGQQKIARVVLQAVPCVKSDPHIGCPDFSEVTKKAVISVMSDSNCLALMDNTLLRAWNDAAAGTFNLELGISTKANLCIFAVNGKSYKVIQLPQVRISSTDTFVLDELTCAPFLQQAKQVLASGDQAAVVELLNAAQHSPYLAAVIQADEIAADRLSTFPVFEESAGDEAFMAIQKMESALHEGDGTAISAARENLAQLTPNSEVRVVQIGSLISGAMRDTIEDAIVDLVELYMSFSTGFWASIVLVSLVLQAAIMYGLSLVGLSGWLSIVVAVLLTGCGGAWSIWSLRISFRRKLQALCAKISVPNFEEFRYMFIRPRRFDLTWLLAGVGIALVINIALAVLL